MNRPTIQLFVNPRAGSVSRERTKALCSALQAEGARVILTESVSEHMSVDERADQLCSAGGDGTLRYVVAAMHRAGRSIPISIYPAGTVNLLAMEYGYPSDPEAFARYILEARAPRRHYGALIDQTPLLACASVGPDSYTVETLSPRLKRLFGRVAYGLALCKVMLRWRRAKIVLLHDDRATECEAVYIAKGRFFAGRWSVAPDACGSDPLLHVVTLRQASRRRFLRFVWALMRRQAVELLPGVECFTCSELTLTGNAALPLQADGDIVAHLPASITLEAEAFCFT